MTTKPALGKFWEIPKEVRRHVYANGQRTSQCRDRTLPLKSAWCFLGAAVARVSGPTRLRVGAEVCRLCAAGSCGTWVKGGGGNCRLPLSHFPPGERLPPTQAPSAVLRPETQPTSGWNPQGCERQSTLSLYTRMYSGHLLQQHSMCVRTRSHLHTPPYTAG